jgi:hypothetical protein
MARSVAAQQLQLETVVPQPPPAQKDTARPKLVGEPDKGESMSAATNGSERVRAAHRPSPAELLETPGALLTRSHLRGLGLERRAIDAVFRALPVVSLPGYSRPMVCVEDYLELVKRNTFRDDRVRPVMRAS